MTMGGTIQSFTAYLHYRLLAGQLSEDALPNDELN